MRCEWTQMFALPFLMVVTVPDHFQIYRIRSFWFTPERQVAAEWLACEVNTRIRMMECERKFQSQRKITVWYPRGKEVRRIFWKGLWSPCATCITGALAGFCCGTQWALSSQSSCQEGAGMQDVLGSGVLSLGQAFTQAGRELERIFRIFWKK